MQTHTHRNANSRKIHFWTAIFSNLISNSVYTEWEREEKRKWKSEDCYSHNTPHLTTESNTITHTHMQQWFTLKQVRMSDIEEKKIHITMSFNIHTSWATLQSHVRLLHLMNTFSWNSHVICLSTSLWTWHSSTSDDNTRCDGKHTIMSASRWHTIAV